MGERLIELRDITKSYGNVYDCCKPGDLKCNRMELIENFMRAIPGGFGSRKPPDHIVDFIDGRASLPLMADVHSLVSAF